MTTIPIDSTAGEEEYAELANHPAKRIIEEKIYGSSLGDIKIVIKYEDLTGEISYDQGKKQDPGYTDEEWEKLNGKYQS